MNSYSSLSVLSAIIGVSYFGYLLYKVGPVVKKISDSSETDAIQIVFGSAGYVPMFFAVTGLGLGIMAIVKKQKYRYIGLVLNIIFLPFFSITLKGLSFIG